MKYKIQQLGFSLVETLVAISLLLIVIVGQMTVSGAAKGSSFATEQIQAFFLAQEGVEMVQNVRDELFLEHLSDVLNNGSAMPSPWQSFTNTTSSGVLGNCYDTKGCGLSFDDSTAKKVEVVSSACKENPANASDNNCLLRVNGNNTSRSRFTHGNPNLPITPFTRKIRITHNSGEPFVKVQSEVTWRAGSLSSKQRVVVDTYLYNTYNYD